MIAAKEYDSQTVKRAYSRRGWLYSKTVARMEWSYHLTAIDRANIQRGEKILEVAVGPGLTIVELAGRVGKDTSIYGIDIAAGMLRLATQRLRAYGFSKFDLKEADSRQLPFEANSFDVVYNGYMLDLIPIQDMPIILAEFRRVLRPGGRLVLLNMSKRDETLTARDRLYQRLPAMLTLYLLGGCRPVLMETAVRAVGFQDVTRTFLDGKAPSEIVLARKLIA
jgi:ubiquinone/menaquinone biosynthesis C-methylase UbiE